MKLPVLRSSLLALAASLLSISALLSGCNGNMTATAPQVAVETPLGTIHGSLHGGREPVVGAALYVYQTGNTGYGSASKSLLTNYTTGNFPTTPDTNGNYYVTSDGQGMFSITGEYTCTAGYQVYLYALGGDPGSGINPAAGFLAALGTCPSTGSMASVTPTVNMNEASTVAAAYALAQFSVDATHIGIPTSTNSTLAALESTNLANAFATAGNLYNVGTVGNVSSFATYTTGSPNKAPVAPITAYSITSGVATFTSANNYNAGDIIALSGFPTSTFLNGQLVTVLSAGLSSTQFSGAVTGYTATITKYGITSNVATFTSANTFYAGEQVTLAGFGSAVPSAGTPFNGQTVTVIATGLSTTKFEANFTNANVTAVTVSGASATINTATVTEAGTATYTPAGVLPTTKLNSLANSLAACVNSIGYTSAGCNGVLGTATDTASAAILIAQNPGANVAAVYNAATGTALPYNNALTTAPNDWTMSIVYSGGGLSAGTAYVEPKMVTVDGSGNIWTLSLGAPWTLSGFTNLGVPLAPSGFTNSCLSYLGSVVPDSTSQNLWIATQINAAGSAYSTYLCEYNIANNSFTTVTPMNGTNAVLDDPADLGFDGSGNLWVASSQNNTLVKLDSTGNFVATATNTATLNTNYYALAVEPGTAGSVWVSGISSTTAKKYAINFTNADLFSTSVLTDYYESTSMAIDAGGNAWATGYATGLTKIPAAGGTTSLYPYKAAHAAVTTLSHVIDGGGNVWLADFANGILQEYNNSGTIISGTYGYIPGGEPSSWILPATPPSGFVTPNYIAIDGSGNVWTKSGATKTLQEMVGVAVPVTTPLSYATTNSLLGQEP